MREAPMGAFGIVERFSTLRPDRLQAPVFDGVLDLAEWNGGSAIVHARLRCAAKPLPFVALYKDTIDHSSRSTAGGEREISGLRVGEGANWVGRNAIARRSASLKSPVDLDPFERPILRSGSGRANECVRAYHDQCVRISGDGCGTPSPCRNVPVT